MGVFVMKKSKSIALKLSSLIIGLFLVLFVTYTVVTSFMLYNQSVDDSESATLQNAQFSAAKMSERFKKANDTLQTTKRIVETMHNNGELSAESLMNILEVNLTKSDDLIAAGAVLEKDFTKIEPTIDVTLIDTQERFVPYVSKKMVMIYQLLLLKELKKRVVPNGIGS